MIVDVDAPEDSFLPRDGRDGSAGRGLLEPWSKKPSRDSLLGWGGHDELGLACSVSGGLARGNGARMPLLGDSSRVFRS